jgi:hypothetical protein
MTNGPPPMARRRGRSDDSKASAHPVYRATLGRRVVRALSTRLPAKRIPHEVVTVKISVPQRGIDRSRKDRDEHPTQSLVRRSRQ